MLWPLAQAFAAEICEGWYLSRLRAKPRVVNINMTAVLSLARFVAKSPQLSPRPDFTKHCSSSLMRAWHSCALFCSLLALQLLQPTQGFVLLSSQQHRYVSSRYDAAPSQSAVARRHGSLGMVLETKVSPGLDCSGVPSFSLSSFVLRPLVTYVVVRYTSTVYMHCKVTTAFYCL